MTLLRVENLKKEYGATSIFQEVAFQLANGDRVGLVGANGTGKTTLLRCLAGKLQPDGGQVHRIGDRVVGYLEQTWTPPPGVTVWQAAASVLATVHEQESRLRHLEELMRQTSGDELERIIEAYAQAMHRFESLGGFQAEANLRAILFGLGLRESQLDQPASELSGGERIRLQLGRLLYENPHVLLLDEPTNHLDLPATEWLEQYLARYEGAIVLVSHDRAFLDAVCTKIFALENGTLSIYSGNFSQYVSQRQAELVLREKLRARQSEQQRQLERFIQKFGAGTRARQAKSRKKQLDRLKKETVPEPQSRERSERFHFHPTGRGARLILQIDRLVVRRQERVLFGPFTSEVQRGERVAIVGPNGSGKSTLLRVLLGAVQPTSGSFAWAQEMKIGYFAQHLDELNDELTILQELTGSADLTYEEARSLLARFNFRGDEVDKKVRSLSGGERNRLSLAKLVVSQCQVMMLDEPTNHLDVSGRQALEAALVEYPGTILFVSHDRYFIKQLADRIWSIEHETLREYGSYDEFVQRNRVLGSDGESQAAVAVFHGVQGRERVGRSDRSNPGREKRRQQQLRKKILEEREQLEDEIAVLEQRLNELNEQLSQPDVFRNEEGLQLSAEYEETEANLQRLYERWLLLEEEHPDGAD